MTIRSTVVAGLTLHYDDAESDAAAVIRDACADSVRVIRKCWGLAPPPGCSVFVMTSWLDFVFRSAPWHRRILLAVLFPLWCFKAMRVWNAAGGWVQGHGQVPAVGIKPPRLLVSADRSVGDKIFVRDVDESEESRQITCHELTHACSNHLRLPTWLHEGIAMVSVDRLRGRPSVKRETLDVVESLSVGTSPSGYPRTSLKRADAWVYLYARGYWLTRYLLEKQPALLRSLLSRRRTHAEVEESVAKAFGKSHEEFWSCIDGVLVAYFSGSGDPQ
jgi:hypothetical protein